MAWVKLDDQAPRNAKLLRAGPSAAWMWVCGIAHCQAHMSEGFIADEALSMIGVTGIARAKKLADVLVSCALFDRVDGGYVVHDYLDFNETREEALARKRSLKAKRAASGRLGGLAKVANRKQTVVADSSPDPTRPDRTKNPLTPFARGRRRKRANGATGGVCGHEPRCESFKACRDRILAESKAS